jgi:ABC-type glycerol-3-phosphate transport system substrate-binding protein
MVTILRRLAIATLAVPVMAACGGSPAAPTEALTQQTVTEHYIFISRRATPSILHGRRRFTRGRSRSSA